MKQMDHKVIFFLCWYKSFWKVACTFIQLWLWGDFDSTCLYRRDRAQQACCTALVNKCCHLLSRWDPSTQRSCLSALVKVGLPGICCLQCGLLSCLEKMLNKKEIELSKVNYWVLWLSLDPVLIVNVIIMGHGGILKLESPGTIHYLAEE